MINAERSWSWVEEVAEIDASMMNDWSKPGVGKTERSCTKITFDVLCMDTELQVCPISEMYITSAESIIRQILYSALGPLYGSSLLLFILPFFIICVACYICVTSICSRIS